MAGIQKPSHDWPVTAERLLHAAVRRFVNDVNIHRSFYYYDYAVVALPA